MQTTDRTMAVAEPGSGTHRIYIYSLAVLVLAIVAAGAWVLVDEYTGVDRDIDVLIAEYDEAWETSNGDAAVALMASFGTHYSTGASDIGGSQLAAFIDGADVQIRPLGEPIIVDTDPVYLVMTPTELTVRGEVTRGFSSYRIGDIDGELKILHHEWIRG